MNISNFTKRAFILARGTVIAQAIILLSSPILTRLYSPEQFGVLALLSSIYSLLGCFTTLKYDQAILIPRDDNVARKLSTLILIITLIVVLGSVFIGFGLIVFKGFASIDHYITLPVLLFFGSLVTILQQWNLRYDQYSWNSLGAIIGAVANTGTALLFFFVGLRKYGLQIGYVMSFVSVAIYYLLKSKGKPSVFFKGYGEVLATARSFIRFPSGMLLPYFLGMASYQLTPILLSSSYGVGVVGQYSLANRLLVLPSILIGAAIGDVFRVEFTKSAIEEGKKLFKRAFSKMALFGIMLFLPLFFLSPILFKIVFGSSFVDAGYYSRYMILGVFFNYLVQNFNNVYVIRNKMALYALFQILLVMIPILVVLVCKLFGMQIIAVLLLVSVMTAIVNTINLYIAYRIS